MTDSLGSQLRRQRQRRQLKLEAVAERTKISIAHLRSLERDDVSQFPPGIFRRSFVRSYAEAIGLDPDEVIADFLAQFPEPEASVNPAGSKGATGTKISGGTTRTRRSAQGMRLALDESASLAPGPTVTPVSQRSLAVVIDLLVIAGCVAGADVVAGTLWVPLAIVSLAYYATSTLVLGGTPGTVFAARRADRTRHRAEQDGLEGASSSLGSRFGASLDSEMEQGESPKGTQVPA